MQRFSEKKVRIALSECMTIVGKNIKFYRDKRNLTQNELAFIIGSSQDIISKIEKNKDYNPEMVTIARIASALEINVMCLFLPTPVLRLTGS